MQKKLEKDYKGVFGLEVTTTEACNYKCSYCFERCHKPNEKTLNASIIHQRVEELFKQNWFLNQYSGIKIILWGGEPTLNIDLCKDLMNRFMEDERICFFIYTNGSQIDKLMPILKRLKKKHFIKNTPKITIQVSYDGNPIHDKNRLDKNGKPTSARAIHAISELDNFDVNFGLKATMPWNDYHLMPDAWEDFRKLHDKWKGKIKYALTVDYYDIQFKKYEKDVKKALIKIAQKEIKFYNKFGYFLSNVFNSNKAICATGKSMAVINTNGDVYNCHGSIYSKCSDDFKYTNIFDKDFINSIEKTNKFYKNNNIEPDECKNCIAGTCLRCNVKKYEESNKETFKERWYDYPAQKELCEYYQLAGKINIAMKSFIRSNYDNFSD